MKCLIFILSLFSSISAFCQFDSVVVTHTYNYSESNDEPYGLHFRSESHYDSLGVMMYSISDQWDGYHFTHDYKYAYVYDGSGRIIETIYYHFINNTWTNYNRHKTFYNTFNKIDSVIYYTWVTSWVASGGNYYLFNANHFLVSESSSHNRTLHYPDALGRDTVVIMQDDYSGSWIDNDKQKFHYGVNGLKDYTVDYTDDGTGTMIPVDSTTHSYYPNDSLYLQSYFYYVSSVATISLTDSIVYSGDTTYTYQTDYPAGVLSNRKIDYYHDPYNYYYVNYSPFNGSTWNDYVYKKSSVDSLAFTAHIVDNDWNSDSSDIIFDNDWHPISSNNAGETHSEYIYYGNTYYYYYLTNGLGNVCPGQSDSLSVVQGMQSYAWNHGGNQNYIIVPPDQEYHCNLINQYGHPFQSEPHFPFLTLMPTAEKNVDSSITVCPSQYGFTLRHSYIPVYQYQWFRNDTAIAIDGNSEILNFSSSNVQKIDGEYKLVISNSCGSDTSSTTTIHFDTLQVQISPLGVKVCPDDTLYRVASSGFSSYLWNTGDTSITVPNYLGHLNFRVVATDQIGCTSIAYNNIYMMFPAYSIPAKIYPQNDSILSGSMSNTGNYQWYRNGVLIPGATSWQYTITQSGSYSYLYTLGTCTILSESKYMNYSLYRVTFGSDTIKFCAGQPYTYIGNAYHISGGQPNYSYSWSPSAGLSNAFIAAPTVTTTIDRDYVLTVTDGLGNISSDTIHVSPRQHQNFSVTSSNDSICPQINSSVILSIPNLGQGSLAWYRNGSNFTPHGLYSTEVYYASTYWVVFNNGCVSYSDSITISTFPNFPSQPSLQFDSIPSDWCAITQADISVDLLNPQDYTYIWHSYNGNPFLSVNGITATISSAGQYGVTVTDVRGCSSFAYIDTENETGQTIISPNLIPDGVVQACFGDTVHLSCANIPNGLYSWYNYGNDLNTFSNQYDAIYSGNYRVTIDYGFGCHAEDSVYVSYANVSSSVDVIDNGFNLLANTLTGYLTGYQWYFYNNLIPGANQSVYHPTAPGWYKVIGNSGSNCGTSMDSVFVSCTVTSVLTQPSCFNSCNGGISVSPGGTGPFTINWSTGDTANHIANLCDGYYIVNVTNQLGCTASDSLRINNPDSLIVINNITNPSCFNQCDGQILINVTGGTVPYSYNLNGQPATQLCEHICPGNYNIIVTDTNGCTGNSMAITDGGPSLIVTDSIRNATCNTCNDGYAGITITGGTQPYDIHWSTNDSTPSVNGLAPGLYFACVTDQNTCIVCDTIIISFSIGIDESDNALVSVFPNPFDKFIVINLSDVYLNDYLFLSNVLGETIINKRIVGNQMILSGEELLNGMYFLELKNSRGEILHRKKIIAIH